MNLLKHKTKLTIVFFLFAILIMLTLIVISKPQKCNLPLDLQHKIVTLNDKSYLMISSTEEEILKNPTFPIECVDYKFIAPNQVAIVKYQIFNFFCLVKDEPIMSTFPILIPVDFFRHSGGETTILYWSSGKYHLLGEINFSSK